MLFKKHFPKHVHHTYTFDFASSLFYGIFFGMTMPFAGVISRKMGASIWGVAIVSAAPYIGSLFSCCWGHKAHGADRKNYYIASMAFSAFFYILLMFFKTQIWVVAIMSLGLFSVFIGRTSYTSIMSVVYEDEFRGKIMSFVKVAYSAGMIIASLFAGRLLDLYGYRVVFPLAGMFGIIAVVIFKKIRISNDSSFVPDNSKLTLSNLMKPLVENRIFRKFQIGYYLFGMGNILVIPLYSLFMVDQLKLDNFTVGAIFMVSSLTGTIGLFIWGHAIDKFGGFRLISYSIFGIGLVPLFYAVANSVWFLYVGAVFWGIGFWCVDLLVTSALIEMVSPGELTKYTGLHYTLMGTRGFIAPFIGVLLVHYLGLRIAFLISAILIIWGAYITYESWVLHSRVVAKTAR